MRLVFVRLIPRCIRRVSSKFLAFDGELHYGGPVLLRTGEPHGGGEHRWRTRTLSQGASRGLDPDEPATEAHLGPQSATVDGGGSEQRSRPWERPVQPPAAPGQRIDRGWL